ncbi:unnamed protein product [Rangifer tarandus platyrhynchus]|uniref:Uncharacterized protein n=2 Tax=Rangifer tarandus platyrhynchus TaxID=3082113 RepID=A0ACB0DU43_RANTA|nr:unnamed protein product [Rangifer tarandus platyrhynchus]CAI9691802.1 unnamed protein product [Rangifer tarandus platyrhynchus]
MGSGRGSVPVPVPGAAALPLPSSEVLNHPSAPAPGGGGRPAISCIKVSRVLHQALGSAASPSDSGFSRSRAALQSSPSAGLARL